MKVIAAFIGLAAALGVPAYEPLPRWPDDLGPLPFRDGSGRITHASAASRGGSTGEKRPRCASVQKRRDKNKAARAARRANR